jgi:hypothetical protein
MLPRRIERVRRGSSGRRGLGCVACRDFAPGWGRDYSNTDPEYEESGRACCPGQYLWAEERNGHCQP